VIDPYVAVALSPRVVTVEKREDALKNVKRINEFMDQACMVASTEGAPVKLIALAEMAIQGFMGNFKAGNREMERSLCLEIGGPETDALCQKAKELDTYIVGELYLVKDPDFPDRYFNVGFICSPQGEIIHQRAKAQSDSIEGGLIATTNPHDLWDEWVEKKGNGNAMDAIYPVAKTDIGNIGICICMEGSYPEIPRGLAMNGAEILIHNTFLEPYVSNGFWELQNRAHAVFNQQIVVAPNLGPQVNKDGFLTDVHGGQSMIVDHRGNIMVKQAGMTGTDTFVSTMIDIEALRRARKANGFYNWFKDLRTEQFRVIYDQPNYPKNQYLEEAPTEGWIARERATRTAVIEDLEKRGVLMPTNGDGTAPSEKQVSEDTYQDGGIPVS
jgi:predicted amidohydrolase